METMAQKYAKLIAKAWLDPSFKTRLLQDTAVVLQENGIEVTEDMAESFVLPTAPTEMMYDIAAEPITTCPIY